MSTMSHLAWGWRAARQEARRQRSLRSGAVKERGRVVQVLAEHGLSILGLGSFVAAAFMVAVPIGLAVAGVAFFVLEWRVGE